MAMTEQKLFEASVRYLQRYAASTAHLRRVLARKLKRAEAYGPVPDADEGARWIDAAIKRCESYGYVDDTVYTESRVRSLRRQGRSTHYIQRYLQEKGVPPALIRNALPRDEDVELAAAQRHVRRRRLGRDTSFEGRQKDLARLARAGFALNVGRQALDTALDTAHHDADDSHASDDGIA